MYLLMNQAITGNNSLQNPSQRKLTSSKRAHATSPKGIGSPAPLRRLIHLVAGIAFSSALATLAACSDPPTEPVPKPSATPSASLPVELTPLQRYLNLSQLRISLKTMHDRYFLDHFKLETGAPNLHPKLVAPVRNYVIESALGRSLLDRFLSEFTPLVSAVELQQMNLWLSSPLGSKVNSLEMAPFTDPNFITPNLKHNTLNPKRQALISDYVDTNRLADISVNVLRLTKMGVLQGIQSVSNNASPIKAPEVTQNDRIAISRIRT